MRVEQRARAAAAAVADALAVRDQAMANRVSRISADFGRKIGAYLLCTVLYLTLSPPRKINGSAQSHHFATDKRDVR